MQWEELGIEGAWLVTPKMFEDERGFFAEAFKADEFEAAVGHPFHLRQANMSVSKAGVVRGIHYADVPPSQAKYVSCTRGAIIDYIVDIRVGSPTFGKSVSVLLDSARPRFVYISEGLGHALCALEDGSTVNYLVSEPFNPGAEHGVQPLDPTLGIEWPKEDLHGNPIELLLSPKDTAAPSLTDAVEQGLLPTYEDCVNYRRSL
ncbi:dTDP-4-dehydrorhamnose 3,5-epimerase family protein [Actinomyces minihominis]|uniref:dTDP-4-dehydrorhamnose 3,5-epimerase family protein n=1 Tax=Actinomyces minihominis TaxID=2002838 RepID=UPI000C06FB14|nr:dTDP-4-dehydrorhamnose 3,5-epimerase [Actinomyces minihominis]